MAVQLERRGRGRPQEYDRWSYIPQLREALALGMSDRYCADLIGVPRDTYQYWLGSDEAFSNQLSRARAEGQLVLMKRVAENPKTAGGAGWLLERRYREDFGQRVDVTHSIDEAQVERLAEQYGVDAADVRSAIAEAAKLLSPPKK